MYVPCLCPLFTHAYECSFNLTDQHTTECAACKIWCAESSRGGLREGVEVSEGASQLVLGSMIYTKRKVQRFWSYTVRVVVLFCCSVCLCMYQYLVLLVI